MNKLLIALSFSIQAASVGGAGIWEKTQLDEEHDDVYEAFFADLAAESGKHRQLLNTRKMHNAGSLPTTLKS